MGIFAIVSGEGSLRGSKRRPGGVRLHGSWFAGCMAVVLTCRPACVGMLQSWGLCQDLNHELFEIVWLCRTGCLSLFGGLGAIVVDSSSLLLALCVGCCFAVAFLGLCMGGSSSVVKLLGGRGAIVVVSSRRLMAMCSLLLSSDCVLLGLCVRGSSSVVKLIGGRVQSG